MLRRGPLGDRSKPRLPKVPDNLSESRQDIPNQAEFYFVHSYYLDGAEPQQISGRTEYGLTFPSAITFNNITAVQFHPEKSGRWGLQLLKNWIQAK